MGRKTKSNFLISNKLSSDDLSFLDKGFADKAGNNFFLKRFNKEEMFALLNSSGLIQHLEKSGFNKILLNIDFDDSEVSILKLFQEEETAENLLIDLRLSEAKFAPDKKYFSVQNPIQVYDMIVIEWLTAQNPFYKEKKIIRQLLPGQNNPGLGALKYCFKMMFLVAEKIFKDGFLVVPDHFHGSVMYGKKFKFFNPEQEAVLRTILRDLKNYTLPDISWGMITETIINQNLKTTVKFEPEEQIFPISEKINLYFDSEKYKSVFKEKSKTMKFYLDYEVMVQKKNEFLKTKKLIDL